MQQIFTDWVADASGGRLLIDWAEPNAIYPGSDSDLAAGRGAVDIAYSVGSYYSGRIPEADLEVGPVFAYRNSAEEFQAMMDYGIYDILRGIYAEHNIYWVPCYVDAMVGIGTSFPAPDAASM